MLVATGGHPYDTSFYDVFNRMDGIRWTHATSQREAFAKAILTLDDSMPTGTYVDMCSKLPLLDPAKLKVPAIILRGEHDGIASMDDLIRYFTLLPHPNKQFSVMEGISHASFQQKNYMTVYHLLHSFFSMPEPVYRG